MRSAFAGSSVNGAMNRKLLVDSAIPRVTEEKVCPPSIDLYRLSPVNSWYTTLGSAGLIATNPPSPPAIDFHAFAPVTSMPRTVPLSCAPPMYHRPVGYDAPW